MKEKTLVSTSTLIGSLASYYYGKTQGKDVVPYVMIGGFIGAWLGEIISNVVIKNKDDDDKPNTNN
jgi:uncharacterized membrane protein YfcA